MLRPGTWHRELTVPLQSIQAELNRLFDEYWRPVVEPGETSRGSAPQGPTSDSPSDAPPTAWTPALDLWDSPGELTLVIDLPGVEPGSIDLSLAGNVLSVSGTKPPGGVQAATPTARGRIKERPAGAFRRQITLVDEIDFDRVEAQAKDGILTVRLPKRGTAVVRTINIQPATT